MDGRDNRTDSELEPQDGYYLPLILHGRSVPGDSRFWFRSKSDRNDFADTWRAVGWTVTIPGSDLKTEVKKLRAARRA